LTDGLQLSDTVGILDRLKGEALVLIGGQAVNYWADLYSERCPELAEAGPYASKDIDFQGRRDQVLKCARLLDGKAHLPEPFSTDVESGKIVLLDNGVTIEVDFLQTAYGLTSKETLAGSILVKVPDPSGSLVPVQIMSPFHCLKSRVYNVVGLQKYRTEHGMRQLRASIVCTREFSLDLAERDVRKSLDQNEAVFKFVMSTKPRSLFRKHGVDVFPAVACPELFPEEFHRRRYPQMQADWEKYRRVRVPKA
jgi:hypothetical protein